MSEVKAIDIVNDALKTDLCSRCTHTSTCIYYDELKQALKRTDRLTAPFNERVTAHVSDGDLEPSPAITKIISERELYAPVVGVIFCNHMEEKDA